MENMSKKTANIQPVQADVMLERKEMLLTGFFNELEKLDISIDEVVNVYKQKTIKGKML